MWIGLFFSTGMYFAIGAVIVITVGAIVFFIRAYYIKDWPFGKVNNSSVNY
jgi:uncharacterized membrane protein